MRKLTRRNFNTPATAREIADAQATMDRQRHVNAHILRTWNAQNRYVLTFGKLYGLTATSLDIDTRFYAKQLNVGIEHPVR